MASKGNKRYIKSLNSPRFFAIHRKGNKYVVRQNPGRHSGSRSIALSLAVRKMGAAENAMEAERIIRSGLVSVNGAARREPKFPVGLNDMISAGGEDRSISIDSNGKIVMSKGKAGEARIYKIVGKYKERKGAVMLRLNDGSVFKAGKEEANVDDSVSLSGKERRILRLGEGSSCSVIEGVHVGSAGTVKSIKPGSKHRQKSAVIETNEGATFETLVKNIIVTG